jgi:hypothetical protein
MWKRLVAVVALLSATALAACGADGGGEFGPQGQRDFAKHFVLLFGERDVAGIEKDLDPRWDRSQVEPVMQKLFSIYPRTKLKRIYVYNWTFSSTLRGGTDYILNLICEFDGDRDLLAKITLNKNADRYVVAAMYFQPVKHIAAEANAFDAPGKPSTHYSFLMLMGLIELLSVFALVRCILTPDIERKWLWIIFILIGAGKVTLNWTTGEYSYSLLSLQFLSAGFVRANYFSPWLFTASLPLGALVFLERRSTLIAKTKASRSAEQGATGQ